MSYFQGSVFLEERFQMCYRDRDTICYRDRDTICYYSMLLDISLDLHYDGLYNRNRFSNFLLPCFLLQAEQAWLENETREIFPLQERVQENRACEGEGLQQYLNISFDCYSEISDEEVMCSF